MHPSQQLSCPRGVLPSRWPWSALLCARREACGKELLVSSGPEASENDQRTEDCAEPMQESCEHGAFLNSMSTAHEVALCTLGTGVDAKQLQKKKNGHGQGS